VELSSNQLVKFFGCDNLNVVVSTLMDFAWNLLLLACEDMQMYGLPETGIQDRYVKLMGQFRECRKGWLEEVSALRDLKRAQDLTPQMQTAIDDVMKENIFHFVPESALPEESRPYFKAALEECMKMALTKYSDLDSEAGKVMAEKLAAAEAELAECKTELEGLRSVDLFHDLETARKERKHLDMKLLEMQKANRELEKKNNMLYRKTLAMGLTDAEIADENMDAEAIRLRLQDPHLVAELGHLRDLVQEKSREVAELQEKLEEYSGMQLTLKEPLDALEPVSHGDEELERKFELLKRKSERLETTNKDLQGKLDGIMNSTTKAEVVFEARRREMQDEIDALKVQMMSQGGRERELELMEESQELRRKLSEAETRNAVLEEEASGTAHGLSNAGQSIQDLERELEASRLAEQTLSGQMSQMSMEMEKLRNSDQVLADLRRQVEEAAAAASSGQEDAELQRLRRDAGELERVREENDELRAALREAEKKSARVDDLEAQLAQAKTKLEQYKVDLLTITQQYNEMKARADMFAKPLARKVFERLGVTDVDERRDRAKERAEEAISHEAPLFDPLGSMPAAHTHALGHPEEVHGHQGHGHQGSVQEHGHLDRRKARSDPRKIASEGLLDVHACTLAIVDSRSRSPRPEASFQSVGPDMRSKTSSEDDSRMDMRPVTAGEAHRSVHFEGADADAPQTDGRPRRGPHGPGLDDDFGSVFFEEYCRRLKNCASAPAFSTMKTPLTKPFQIRHLLIDAQTGRPCGRACIPSQKVQPVLGSRLPEIDGGPEGNLNVGDASDRGNAKSRSKESSLGQGAAAATGPPEPGRPRSRGSSPAALPSANAGPGPLRRPSSAAVVPRSQAPAGGVMMDKRPLSGILAARKGAVPGTLAAERRELQLQHLPPQPPQPLLRRRPDSGQ
jgi:hypothetical protein